MPAVAYLLAGLFVLLAVLAGTAAWWLVGPRRGWALPLPILAAFAALYLAGHRFGWQVGPMTEILGFRLALVFDMALALIAAVAAAIAQRTLAGLGRHRSGST